MPVRHLEGLTSKAARERLKTLTQGRRGTAQVAAVFCSVIEYGLWMAGVQTYYMLSSTTGLMRESLVPDDVPRWVFVLVVMAAQLLVEPVFAGIGFALYINRRVELEGWDLELAFRALRARASRKTAKVSALVASVLLALMPLAASAQEALPGPPPTPHEAIKGVLSNPDFDPWRPTDRWSRVESDEKDDDPQPTANDGMNFFALGAIIAEIMPYALGAIAAILIGHLLLNIVRNRMQQGLQVERGLVDSIEVIEPKKQQLPDDVVAWAREHWARGEQAAALSMLYRGALAFLRTTSNIDFPEGATEQECVALVRSRLPDTPPREIASTLIRFEAKGRIPTVSVSRLLHGDVPTALIEGRYVLVGSTAAGLGDRFATPLGRDHPLSGVEIEANLLDTLLRGPGLREADVVLRLAVGLALLWLTMLGLARLPPRAGRVLWTAAIGAPLALCASLFLLANLWLAPTAPTLVVALALPIWSWRRERQTNALVVEALSNLAADPDLTAAHGNPARFVDDKAADQLRLVQETVARVRGLRRLVNAAVRSLPDATVLIALTGEIVLANQEALRLFRARSDVTREDIEGFFAASRPPPFTPNALGRPDGGWAGERPGADGSLRDIRYVPWTDESGETLGWVVRFADITALRRAEIAREEALQLLTHDMRSPQASIIALVSRWEEAPPERLRERIAHYARRTIALADGFLQLARADAGGYEMAPVDLRDVLTEAADDLWALSTAKTIAIRQKPSTAECLVLGNHSLLMRAFANLLDNAVKFSEPGSRIECEVLREERASGPVVIATIADQGVGIPREALDRLFRRFSPHRQPRQHGVSGVGLGLAFVESVVQGHGGRIACRSAVGVGTTFDLEFPALPGPRRGPTGSGRVHGEQADEQKT